MKLAMFGGSGLAGGAVVDLALTRGHQVRALVRPETSLPASLAAAEIVRGDALDAQAVAETVVGADAVISTLGGFRGPESLSAGTSNIIAAMRRHAIRRLVVVQGFHLRFAGDPNNPARLIVEFYLGVRCRPILEHSAELGRLLRETTDLDWTLVRVPPIVAKAPTGSARLGRFALGPLSYVTTGDIATHVLDFATGDDRVHDAPMLHTPRRAGSVSELSRDAGRDR